MPPPQVITLTEYVPYNLPQDALTDEQGEALYRVYGNQVNVEFPSPRTDRAWRLTSQGWVGYLPFFDALHFRLEPKTQTRIGNIFRMLEYAYRLNILFPDDLFASEATPDFYDRWANILAQRVRHRARKGLYRAYIPKREESAFLRGRADITRWAQQPWNTSLVCEYQEHTADIEDNQILAWTLNLIARSGSCTDHTLSNVRQAFRELDGLTTLHSLTPQNCVGRLYQRLNQDYEPLHALCRFFLEHSGPGYQAGEQKMLPFLVNMNQLFELFIAEWLNNHLEYPLRVHAQKNVSITEDGTLVFKIDLVILNVGSGITLCVMDTKYKTPEKPSTQDISQVVAYAESQNCQLACLVYPNQLPYQSNIQIGNIQVHSLTFDIEENLEAAGRRFLGEIVQLIH